MIVVCALALAGNRVGWGQYPIQRLPYVGDPSQTVVTEPWDFSYPTTVPSVQTFDHPAARLTSELDDSAVSPDPKPLDCPPPEIAFELGSCDGRSECWSWQMLPEGLIYRAYLAGVKESRFAAQWVHERRQGGFYDVALGGRVPIVRYGTTDPLWPEGWQVDFEGAVFPRIEAGSLDVTAMDFRYGVPLSFGWGRHRTKLAFYHLSSHLADEFMLKHPSVPRINYLRDALAWGHSFYPTTNLRLYVEAAYAFRVDDGAQPWEFQFGVDYSPAGPTGLHPVPFFAVNGHLREEIQFGGNLTVQVGYQWRGVTGHLVRLGLHYYTGKSDQYEFFNQFEDKIGLGIWYDF